MADYANLQPSGQVPQPAPAYPVSFPTGQPNKVHHSYIWLSSLIGVGVAVGVALLSSINDIVSLLAMLGGTGRSILLVLVLGVLGVVLIYGIMVGVSALAYKNLRFVFEAGEFSLYSGIITKKRVHVPYARVQSVNHKQSLFQRIAGVCTVEIDTAGGASNKAVKVPYVELATGEAIRADLFVRKAASLANAADAVVYAPGVAPAVSGVFGVQDMQAGAIAAGAQGLAGAPGGSSVAAAPGGFSVAAAPNILDDVAGGVASEFRGLYGGAVVGMEPVSFERRLANGELFLTSISGSAVVSSAVSLAVLLAAVLVGLGMQDFLVPIAGFVLVPLFIVGFVVLVGISVASVALSYGNFAVRRRGMRVEVERGILQRSFTGIDVDRIQSIVVRQSLVRKLMGYCEVSFGRIDTASDENQGTSATLNRRGLVVHPFIKVDQVEPLLAQLVPEYADRPVASDFKGLPKVALRRGILRRGLWRNGLFWAVLPVALAHVAFGAIVAPELAQTIDGAQAVRFINVACALLYAVFALQMVGIVVGSVWWARGSGFATNARYLALHNDGLHTETVYIPRQKVQDVSIRSNPFQRRVGVATIAALTAAGVGGTYSGLWDVSLEDAQSWLDWLKPRTSVVQ